MNTTIPAVTVDNAQSQQPPAILLPKALPSLTSTTFSQFENSNLHQAAVQERKDGKLKEGRKRGNTINSTRIKCRMAGKHNEKVEAMVFGEVGRRNCDTWL
jgi:hypothetical protein